MKSGGPWNLRGLRPQAREAAREAARRSGMSVGEWLNSVIRPADDEDAGMPLRPGAFEREPVLEYDWRPDDDRRGRHRQERQEQEREDADETPVRHAGRPYREPRRPDHVDRPRRERKRDDEAKALAAAAAAAERDKLRETSRAREELGEVNARLDNLSRQIERLARVNAAPPRVAPPRRSPPAPYESNGESRRLTGAPPLSRRVGTDSAPRRAPAQTQSPVGDRSAADGADLSIEQAVAEITARQRVLDSEDVAPSAPSEAIPTLPPAAPLTAVPLQDDPARSENPHVEGAAGPTVDLGGLDRQLRQITARIEALRPARDLEKAMTGLRGDLNEIGRLITEALPRRAVESLEIEVKALAQRIDHSRQSGVDSGALVGVEQGLAEIREALRGLTTAESLIGVDDAVKALAQKVDLIAAKEDPAALQQLETAIGALRGIVSHVASSDALTKVAEDVRSLAAKVDGVANSAASSRALSALESRIDTLANALNASTEAGQAVPRELEKLLAGLIEKLEWVQLTHTDHAALAHLEDRIAMLVKRLDASDSRLGQLAGVERGLTDLLVHLEQIRGSTGYGDGGPKIKLGVDAIERDVAEIKQSERRTKDSLEAVHGTVEHVVDRLATIESDIRGDKVRAPAQPTPAKPQQPAAAPPTPSSAPISAPMPPASTLPPVPAVAAAAQPAPKEPVPSEPALSESPPPRSAGPRPPIDPNLPPNHPLEPGSTSSRSRQPASAAERIAASEAAIGGKPPVIPDPGSKSDFIAAARRAARTAALDPTDRQAAAEVAGTGAAVPKKLTQRLRALIVAAAIVVIAVGCFHIASRLFEDGGASAPPEAQADKTPPPSASRSDANPANPPKPSEAIPLPVPAAKSPASAAAPSNAAPQPPASAPPASPPPAPAGAKPRRQSLNESPDSFVTAPQTAAATIVPGSEGMAAQWAVPDITASLPRSPATPSTATAPAPSTGALDDKLPATIGGPALRAAALGGDAAAAYEVATRFAEGHGVPQNNQEAAHWLERAAKMGLAPAQFRLGGLYEKGIGVKKNLGAARDLYRAAADQGHSKAMHNLAVLYAEGIDGSADYHAAAQWFHKAAEHGLTDSQYNLAILYARGIGVEQSFAESYKWFSLAAKQGDGDAAKKRDEVASHLDHEALAAARLATQAWRPEPQPAEANAVKIPAAWDAPANGMPAKSRPRLSGAKAPSPDAAKID